MRLTARGRRCVLAVALLAGFAAGMTAQLWDPWTRGLDGVSSPVMTNLPGAIGSP